MSGSVLAAVASGSLVGFTLGLIGGGGSILVTPLLLYVVGMGQPRVAIGTSAHAVSVNVYACLSEGPAPSSPQRAALSWASRNNSMVFYSVVIDDPSLLGPINATLFPTDADPNRFQLVWRRYQTG